MASAGQGPWSEGSPDRGLTGGGALGPAVIGDDGPCWMVCTGGHCASTGGISRVVLLDPARVGLWSERLRDQGLAGSGALGPAVIGDDGPRWMVYIGGLCASTGGMSGTGLASGGGVHPCDYEIGLNGTRLALGMLRGDWPARARSGLAPGMPACVGSEVTLMYL